ncbi:MAG TPA: LysE family translocator [Methylibium sp.]
MSSATDLALYFAIVFGIIVLPGMDMAFVLGNSLAGGRRAGMAAVAGIIAGGLCHMGMGATGVSLLMRALPGLFTLMLLAGSLYVAWMGGSLLRASRGGATGGSPALNSPAGAARPSSAFRGALLTSLLNPKAYLFTLAILPQFLHPQQGSIWLQVGALTLITSATQAGVYGTLALLASRSRAWLDANEAANRVVMRGVGVLLLAAAVFTGMEGLRALQGAASRPSAAAPGSNSAQATDEAPAGAPYGSRPGVRPWRKAS